MSVVLFNFFKFSVFANAWVDMGNFILVGLGVFLSPLLHDIVHVLLQFFHLSPEYPFDNHFESIEEQDGGQ